MILLKEADDKLTQGYKNKPALECSQFHHRVHRKCP